MKNVLVWIAISISLVAAIVSLVAMKGQPGASAGDGLVDLSPLEARITALEKNVEQVRKLVETDRLASPPAVARESQNAKPDPRIDDLLKRLDGVEKSVADDHTLVLAQANLKSVVDMRGDRSPRSIDEVTRQARDLAATEEQRLAALRDLRGRKLADGTDARMPVLDDMIRLAQTSANAETRTDVWRQLNHITDLRLKGPLLVALASDPDPHAREKAADTLADFMPDAQVESALRAAMQNDADAKVRSQAFRSLNGNPR
jgi:hypothetical protein